MEKQDIVGYRTPLDAARRYKLEKVKVLKVAEDGSVAEVMLKGDAKDGSKITLKADQIDLKGKNINLTGDDVTISSTNFNVDKNGKMACSNANITGGSLTVGSNFSVNSSGVLNCTNATVSGTITSSNGTIGGWEINSSGLTNSAVRISSDGSTTIYTAADLIIMRGHIMGYTGFDLGTGSLMRHYDLDGDGTVGATDYVILKNLIGLDPDN